MQNRYQRLGRNAALVESECAIRWCLFRTVCVVAVYLLTVMPQNQLFAHDAGKESFVAGDENEEGDDHGFLAHNIEVLSHLTMAEIGGDAPVSDRNNWKQVNGSDIWGWTDPETLREYALVGRSDSLAFVDVSTPTAPIYLGSLPTHTFNYLYRDVKTFGNYAYIVSDVANHGMQVFDLTRLRDLSEAPDEFWQPDAHYGRFGNAHNIVINPESGRTIAVGSNTQNGGLHFVDISEPLQPSFAGGMASIGYTHDAQAITYRGPDEEHEGREIVLAFTIDSMSIVDATTPNRPRRISRTSYEDHHYAHQGWVTEDHRFVLMNDELDEMNLHLEKPRTHVWNIEDLENPKYMGFHEGSVKAIDHNLYVRGEYVYQSHYLSGLRVLKMSDVESGQLEEVAWLDTHPTIDALSFGGVWSAYPYFDSGTIVMSDMSKGLIVARLDLPVVGDFNDDGVLGIDDLNLLEDRIALAAAADEFDLNEDGHVDELDRLAWVRDVKQTFLGDANLDGVFDSSDLVFVFQRSEYEDNIVANSRWQTGDWNGDREFDTSDLVAAFQDGGYTTGEQKKPVVLPEPMELCLLSHLVISILIRRHRRNATGGR